MIKKFIGPFLFVLILFLLFSFPFASSWMDKSLSEITIKNPPPEPWFLKDEKKEYVLVYFGYVGCSTICMLSLNEIVSLYEKIDEQNLDVPFYFININPSQDSKLPELFVNSYDKRFNGVYADAEQIKKLEKEYSLAIDDSSIEITHTSNLFLFKKSNSKYSLEKIYITHPYDSKALLQTILK